MTETTIIDWVRGDHLGLDLPAHPEALKAGGPEFLTQAFRAAGTLGADNHVTQITRFDEWMVGGTGPKALLSVTYARDEPNLPRDLFVKFSRSFTDRVRDAGKYIMEPEARLALLSRDAAFPVTVPACLYADFHRASFTGVIITARVPYGQGSTEPHFPKCMDHVLPEPLAHYRELLSTMAQLSGAHKAGRLGDAVERNFPLDLDRHYKGACARFDSPQLIARVNRVADFIAQYPHLAPPNVADPAFLDHVRAFAPLVAAQHEAIARYHISRPDMIALCHWNAQVDNAWFWREPNGALRCGLIDWGGVGQIPIAQSLSGCLSGCEPDFLDAHLDNLIDHYIAEFARAGGPQLDRTELKHHYELGELMAAVTMTTAPPAILREVPDPAQAADRYDPVFTVNETARVQLKITINHLNAWQRRDLSRHLRDDAPWRR
jgi:hypothetical protein